MLNHRLSSRTHFQILDGHHSKYQRESKRHNLKDSMAGNFLCEEKGKKPESEKKVKSPADDIKIHESDKDVIKPDDRHDQ